MSPFTISPTDFKAVPNNPPDFFKSSKCVTKYPTAMTKAPIPVAAIAPAKVLNPAPAAVVAGPNLKTVDPNPSIPFLAPLKSKSNNLFFINPN